jgi:hypothetical protein
MPEPASLETVRAAMPLLADNEGVWEGTYRYYDAATGKLVDEHSSRLICRLTAEGEFPYHQTNYYYWADGRSEIRDFPAWYADGRIWWDNDLIKGWAAAMRPDDFGRSHMAVVPQRQMLPAHPDRRGIHHPRLAELDRHLPAKSPISKSFLLLFQKRSAFFLFFFEIKNQKTFGCFGFGLGVDGLGRRTRIQKF